MEIKKLIKEIETVLKSNDISFDNEMNFIYCFQTRANFLIAKTIYENCDGMDVILTNFFENPLKIPNRIKINKNVNSLISIMEYPNITLEDKKIFLKEREEMNNSKTFFIPKDFEDFTKIEGMFLYDEENYLSFVSYKGVERQENLGVIKIGKLAQMDFEYYKNISNRIDKD